MLLSKATYSQSYVHSYANQHIRSSFGVQYLSQGHFSMQTRGIEPATRHWLNPRATATLKDYDPGLLHSGIGTSRWVQVMSSTTDL